MTGKSPKTEGTEAGTTPSPCGQAHRWQFSPDNQVTSVKSVAAVAAAMIVNLLAELDDEQLESLAGIMTSKLGLPVAVVSGGVALFEFWRKDR